VTGRHLMALSEGIYSVSDVCHVLRPMTPRRVHYWLSTGLISGPPVAQGGHGQPTLLTFRQLLEVRTVQHLRDELKVPLPRVRDAFSWILDNVFENGLEVAFGRGPKREVTVTTEDGQSFAIATGQGVIPNIKELNAEVHAARNAWTAKRLQISRHVVTDTRILAGSPTLEGTRIETSIIAGFAEDGRYDDQVIDMVLRTYPRLNPKAVVEAFEFEGIAQVA
jgi:uncharacterized protein (DUF433 family)